jgi:hypothetical protein
MNGLKITLGSTCIDLNDTVLSLVLTSPYPLMASGYNGGNFIFDFELPATPELKKELAQAHRPGALVGVYEIPFTIETVGFKYSGTATLTEASEKSYSVFCTVGNGDFNTAAKSIKLNEIDLGGEMGGNFVVSGLIKDFVIFQSEHFDYTITEEIAFDNIATNDGELNTTGTIFTASENRSITIDFALNVYFDANACEFRIYKNDILQQTSVLTQGMQTKSITMALTMGDEVSWKIYLEPTSPDPFEVNFTLFIDSSVTVYGSNSNSSMLEGATKRYPDINFAVFPIQNPYAFDKWPDDFYNIDNDSIKVLYSTIFKVINYWDGTTFPSILANTEITNTVGNLFVPFPYLAYVIGRIANHFNYTIVNNVFDSELKYAVLINHFIENKFLTTNPKMLTPDGTFNLADHVPDYTVYDFMQHVCNLFGLGYEINNELGTITFNFVNDIVTNTTSNDIGHLVIDHPVVQFDKTVKAYSLEQKIPSEDKYLSEIKSMTGINIRGEVFLIDNLPLTAAINDSYYVWEVAGYMIWSYNPDLYEFGWVFYSRRFIYEIVSGDDPQKISTEICPLLNVKTSDPLNKVYRLWEIPASHQQARFEGMPDMFQSNWKPGIVWYHGLQNDGNSDLYPFASSGITDLAGFTIPGASLSLTLDGASGLYEQKWKTYLDWRITAKPVKVYIIPDHTFLHTLKFSKKVQFNGMQYLIAEARGNISKYGPGVWELSLLCEGVSFIEFSSILIIVKNKTMLPGNLETVRLIRGNVHIESFDMTFTEDNVVHPLDLTLYDDIVMEVRRKDNPFSELIFQLSLGDGIEISGTDHNRLTAVHSSEKMLLFNSDGDYYRDYLFIKNNERFTLLKGKMNIIFNNTQ